MRYFKGFYFKCSSNNDTIAFIPAVHRCGAKETASLQIITKDRSFCFKFRDVFFHEKEPGATIGKNVFSSKGIHLDLVTDSVSINGEFRFQSVTPLAYDIMGPFKFIPFMQCRHSVFSMYHKVNGFVNINGRLCTFKNGAGYIEGDRGSSFPSKYVWTHCFFKNGSLMLSAADIPLAGLLFDGIIAAIRIDGREYRLATYLGAVPLYIGRNRVEVHQGDYRFTAELISERGKPLKAPSGGGMLRTIHESLECTAHYRFEKKGKPLLDFISDKASFEYEWN